MENAVKLEWVESLGTGNTVGYCEYWRYWKVLEVLEGWNVMNDWNVLVELECFWKVLRLECLECLVDWIEDLLAFCM